MKLTGVLIAFLLFSICPLSLEADLPSRPILTLEVARKITAAAEAEARERGSTVVIVVVDDGG